MLSFRLSAVDTDADGVYYGDVRLATGVTAVAAARLAADQTVFAIERPGNVLSRYSVDGVLLQSEQLPVGAEEAQFTCVAESDVFPLGLALRSHEQVWSIELHEEMFVLRGLQWLRK